MRSTRIHTQPSQPTQWSFCLGMFARMVDLSNSLGAKLGNPKPEFASEPHYKEAGR